MDKSLLVYNGKPQREYLFDLLTGCCDQVFTSCRKDQNVPGTLKPLPDSVELPGPLNGILSAMAFDAKSSWLVIAVDMPFVTAEALELLIGNRDKNKMATCFFNRDAGQPEPLFTLWEPHAYTPLLEFAKKGNMSPRDFLKTHPVKMILPPDEKTLRNINYPEEM